MAAAQLSGGRLGLCCAPRASKRAQHVRSRPIRGHFRAAAAAAHPNTLACAAPAARRRRRKGRRRAAAAFADIQMRPQEQVALIRISMSAPGSSSTRSLWLRELNDRSLGARSQLATWLSARAQPPKLNRLRAAQIPQNRCGECKSRPLIESDPI